MKSRNLMGGCRHGWMMEGNSEILVRSSRHRGVDVGGGSAGFCLQAVGGSPVMSIDAVPIAGRLNVIFLARPDTADLGSMARYPAQGVCGVSRPTDDCPKRHRDTSPT